jgi:maltose-binding protein MalE
MMKSYRKDFVFKSDKTWDIMEDMRAVWEQEGNWGRIYQYDMAKNLNDMSKVSWLRYGMTGMVFDDVFSNVHLAHYLSRVRAYDDVFSEFGFADWKKIAIA